MSVFAMTGNSGNSGTVQSGNGFDPSQLTNLALWVKSDAGLWQDVGKTVPASSGDDPIGAWADQSGNGEDLLTALAGERPILKLAQINGFASVLFDGIDDVLSTAGAIGISGDAAYTVYVVLAHVSATREEGVFGWGDPGILLKAAGLYGSATFGGGSSGLYSTAHAGGNNYNSDRSQTTAWSYLVVKKTAGAIDATTQIRKNGVLGLDNGGSSTGVPNIDETGQKFHLGAWAGAASKGNIHYAELAVCSAASPNSQVSGMETYFQARYGI